LRSNSWATHIRYILSTGSNWKNGIEQFELEVSGAPVIFAKVDGQTFFDLDRLTLTRSDFRPKKDILVEFVHGKKKEGPQIGIADVPLVIPYMRLYKKVDGPANCRKSANLESELVVSIPNAERVKILKRTNDWYQVQSGNKTCWTHRKNLLP